MNNTNTNSKLSIYNKVIQFFFLPCMVKSNQSVPTFWSCLLGRSGYVVYLSNEALDHMISRKKNYNDTSSAENWPIFWHMLRSFDVTGNNTSVQFSPFAFLKIISLFNAQFLFSAFESSFESQSHNGSHKNILSDESKMILMRLGFGGRCHLHADYRYHGSLLKRFYYRIWHFALDDILPVKQYKVENLKPPLVWTIYSDKSSPQRLCYPRMDLMKSTWIEKWNLKINQKRAGSDGEYITFGAHCLTVHLTFSSRGVFF